MNAIEKFEESVRETLRAVKDVAIELSRPLQASGVWTLGLAKPSGYSIEIEWRPHRGFGLSAGRDLGFGMGVDEIYGSGEETLRRTVELLESEAPTNRDAALSLEQARLLRRLTQMELAELLGVGKSVIAQRESMSDVSTMRIDTLVQFARALGADLDIGLRFRDGSHRRLAID